MPREWNNAFAIAVLSCLTVSCSRDDSVLQGNGYLLYGAYGVAAINLDSGEVQSLYEMDSVSVKHVSSVESNALVLSTLDLAPTKARSKVLYLDLNDGSLTEIAEGHAATALGKGNQVVYYDIYGSLSKLNLATGVSIVVYEARNFLPSPVVEVADGKFLFESRELDETRVWEHDLATGISVDSAISGRCSLQNAIWRTRSKELLCATVDSAGAMTGEYVLMALNGSTREIPIELEGYWPVAYGSRADSLVIQTMAFDSTRGREMAKLWVYGFSDNSLTVVRDDLLAGHGAVVDMLPGSSR